MTTDSPHQHSISLNGSAELVTEFFAYGVNTLLFQRGIYAPETFVRVQKYGMTMLVSTDPGVKQYLDSVLAQMRHWLELSQLQRVVVVIASVATGVVLERWAFDVGKVEEGEGGSVAGNEAGSGGSGGGGGGDGSGGKSEKQIMGEIQAVVRQITASVTFLPLLEEACSFDMLIYTKEDTETPTTWEESGPRTIKEKGEVMLRSFSTAVHKVDASVSYAKDDALP